jgi:hypothetical protein
VQKLLPDHVDNVALILDLDNIASQHGMPIENVDVSTPASSGANGGNTVAAIGVGSQKYDSVTIRFATNGTYANFVGLLQELERALRVVDLVSLSIAPNTKGPVFGEPEYTYEIVLRTYWLK